MATKYKITPDMLETRHNIAKLERDGFNREQIHKEMYKVTDGASDSERRRIMDKLYDRSER
jgi:hypothetical protein